MDWRRRKQERRKDAARTRKCGNLPANWALASKPGEQPPRKKGGRPRVAERLVPQVPIPPAGQTKNVPGNFLPGACADCRQRGSSFSSAAFLVPAGGQLGGHVLQKQTAVARDGVSVRFRSAPA